MGTLLRALKQMVRPGGLLVFSVHNESFAIDAGVKFDAAGTHFISSSESPSIDGDTYGTTFTTRKFVIDSVKAVFDVAPLHYQAPAFWHGQDGVVVRI